MSQQNPPPPPTSPICGSSVPSLSHGAQQRHSANQISALRAEVATLTNTVTDTVQSVAHLSARLSTAESDLASSESRVSELALTLLECRKVMDQISLATEGGERAAGLDRINIVIIRTVVTAAIDMAKLRTAEGELIAGTAWDLGEDMDSEGNEAVTNKIERLLQNRVADMHILDEWKEAVPTYSGNKAQYTRTISDVFGRLKTTHQTNLLKRKQEPTDEEKRKLQKKEKDDAKRATLSKVKTVSNHSFAPVGILTDVLCTCSMSDTSHLRGNRQHIAARSTTFSTTRQVQNRSPRCFSRVVHLAPARRGLFRESEPYPKHKRIAVC